MLVVIAPDKFRGSLTACEVAAALSKGFEGQGVNSVSIPLSDGGEGFLDVLGGPNRVSTVSDAFGNLIDVPWRLVGSEALIESAKVIGSISGFEPSSLRAEQATTRGIGTLISDALHVGANKITIGIGGSVTTDGGFGALEALEGLVPFDAAYDIVLATDVTTPYLDAAKIFGPQKGADSATIRRLEHRLTLQAEEIRARFGRDVTSVAGSGAAGGLAGALWAAGGQIVPGFRFVAERVGLASILAGADLIVTGEGRLDETSYVGKVVGGVLAEAARLGIRAIVVVGQADVSKKSSVPVIDLSERFGQDQSLRSTAECLTNITTTIIMAAE